MIPYSAAWLLLAGLVAVAMVLLALPLRAPIGAMYWDTYTYYDAANRILTGQIPIRDFFTPAGPLGYAIAALWIWAFPNGQPSLLLHWSTLTMSLPLMALVLAGLPRESRSLAPWLVMPFVLFSLLPFNGKEYYPFPGSDGFGYYNRQTCLVLFPLVAGLVFVRQRTILTVLVVASMLMLFFLKITGFVAAGLICCFALIAGRLRLRDAVVSALCFTAILAVIEISSRLVSGYLADIAVLLGMNTGTLLPRVLQALSINFGLVASLGLLILVLLVADRTIIRAAFARLIQERSFSALSAFLDHPSFWLATLAAAGMAFETQNTGSQAMIFVGPVLLWIVKERFVSALLDRTTLTVFALAGAVYLPLVVNVIERAARAYVGTIGNVVLVHKNLGTLGNLNGNPEVFARAETMAAVYANNRSAFDDIAARGEMPSYLLYSDFDFQILYLMNVDRAIDAIRALEAEKGVRFETVMSLNFTNPVPWLMGRRAPLAITVGADPYRAVPPLDAEARKAVGALDLALMPTCPPTPANLKLAGHFAEPLAQHLRVRLTECYDGFLHPKYK
ncbi:MAG: hypothetical protein ACRC7C_09320 [Beijerinckiaceae bacterium]